MKVHELRERFGLEMAAGAHASDREVTDGYCGDLLSDVMANAPRGSVWLTMQGHPNIVAVAMLREVAAIILVNGRIPNEETRAKADEEAVPILCSPLTAYQLAGRLYEAGIGRKQG